MEKRRETSEGRTESAEAALHSLISEQLKLNAGRHPGIITEAIIDAVLERYSVRPREMRHLERRKNHPERIRRISHAAFRLDEDVVQSRSAEQIADAVRKSFILVPRDAGASQGKGDAG